MTEVTYDLSKTKEIPERFRSGEVKYNLPSTIEEIRGLVAEGVDADEVIVAGFNGQGYRLSIQKRIKDILASDAVKEMDGPAGIAHAVQVATSEKLGAPRARGTGGSKGKVAQAEAKAASAVDTILDMYRQMPAALRKKFRPQILEKNPQVTAEQLDAVDAEG